MTSRQSVRPSGWGQLLVAALLGLALIFAAATPALAHKDHQKKMAEAARLAKEAAQPGTQAPSAGTAPALTHAAGGEMMDGMPMGMDRSQMSFFARLVDWFGRLHPLVVHFPIAFFPAALITAIAGKRRPSFAAPVQFLVVAGGIFAPIAAGAGWLAAMASEPETVLNYHRWLGVAIAFAGAGLAIWAWRRPWEDRGAGMILALTVMTLAIAAQGFMGAGLTHGMDHMMF
ncbi:MAG: hypothetical protein H0W92_02635 [Sphingomonas sp.]|nr:hypothetical protein [Sphingomonas sp.]